MTVSICDTGVRDAGSGFAAHLLGNLGQVASPLQGSVASFPATGGVMIK